jgi:hypothetical protein
MIKVHRRQLKLISTLNGNGKNMGRDKLGQNNMKDEKSSLKKYIEFNSTDIFILLLTLIKLNKNT